MEKLTVQLSLNNGVTARLEEIALQNGLSLCDLLRGLLSGAAERYLKEWTPEEWNEKEWNEIRELVND